jgi:hypothetical protein
VSSKATLSYFCPMSPLSMFLPIASLFSGIFAVTRSNIRVTGTLSGAYRFSPDVACFHVFAHPPFSIISAVTWGYVSGRVKLSDACPFSPDIAHFHVFADRLAVFMRFGCNTEQRTCPRHVMRALPLFARRRPFPVFAIA